MGKKKRKAPHLTPAELDAILKAKKDNGVISFENGKMICVNMPKKNRTKQHKTDTVQLGTETESVELVSELGSFVTPIQDLLLMVQSLELYAAHYSERLSVLERRREDCSHQLEPQRNDRGVFSDQESDEVILAIGRKLQRIGAERRKVKNQFEIVKTVKRGFNSPPGKAAIGFLANLVAEVNEVIHAQEQRTYTPRTNELDDIYGKELPKFVKPEDEARQALLTSYEEELEENYVKELLADIVPLTPAPKSGARKKKGVVA